ncbi:kinase domain-containing protein [Melanomma pulvis-pyrius CBS 109.77]|uniref:Kinase domain-containing protein n=1 Tax=Melanomma pulvis-pyrius CBS 109.77 TaxID=1314802 RepID=A0A6A6WY80_9PLEO|nr:kinase domain-containing protein [Melanomma pulvis-pyrius CBS 109.77]
MAPEPDYGDFVDSEEEFEFDETAEVVDGYRDGSYYPICIGELLNQRYRIEHKLGHGSYSTVWMAYDTQIKRDVALKIISPGTPGDYELSMQNEIIQAVPDISNIVTYLEHFLLVRDDLNTVYRVLVFPVRGPSLGSIHVRELPGATRMCAAKQFLTALQSLHSGGIVHRDINSGSLLFGVAPLDKSSTSAKYQCLGRPMKRPLPTNLWKSGEWVKPLEVPHNMLKGQAYLCDFGLSIKAGTEVEDKIQGPPWFCAPERYHNIGPSFASDMWSYTCLFAELYFGWNPFSSFFGGTAPDIPHMVYVLGPLPENWEGYYYDIGRSDKSWYGSKGGPVFTEELQGMIERARPETGITERMHVLSIMSKGFCYQPEHRITAAQLLEDASFQALMQIYQV